MALSFESFYEDMFEPIDRDTISPLVSFASNIITFSGPRSKSLIEENSIVNNKENTQENSYISQVSSYKKISQVAELNKRRAEEKSLGISASNFPSLPSKY